MFESESSKRRDFSKFDSMSTEMLQDILRQDFLLPEEESDTDAILYITEVLAKRENQSKNDADVEAAWNSFNENYRFNTDSIYDTDTPETDSDNRNSTSSKLPTKPRRLSAFRILSVASILVLVIILGTITSYAMGYNLFGAVVSWTEEIFGFSFSDSESSIKMAEYPEALSELFDAFIDYQIPTTILPQYLPDGYNDSETLIMEALNYTDFYTRLSNGTSDIILHYRLHDVAGYTSETEKSASPPEIYYSNGNQYYIMTNVGRYLAIWTNENVECCINQVESREELKRILDSIGV